MIDLSKSVNKIEYFLGSKEIVVIVVGQSDPLDNPDQLHCGIVFNHQNAFNFIHLAWHFELRHEVDYKRFSEYVFIKSTIHPSRQLSIAAMCRRILVRHSEKNIPYGVQYSGGGFTSDGVLCLDDKDNGLTCATFILALYRQCGISLIDINNWQKRDSDQDWHKLIIDALKNSRWKFNISESHIENVSKEMGCARFRPEEVAISSAFILIPADSNDIVSEGEKLRNELLRPT